MRTLKGLHKDIVISTFPSRQQWGAYTAGYIRSTSAIDECKTLDQLTTVRTVDESSQVLHVADIVI